MFVDSLLPSGLPEPAELERRYPPRVLPDGAKVTRLGPSPTGPMHIGGLYTALICQDVARHSGGRYLVRVEDTDQAREVPGAREQFERAFRHFGLVPDESESAGGDYGPYVQSAREAIYLCYARDLLRRGLAYPCFATKEELAAAAESQRAAKLPTGYYGRWASWRDASAEAVRQALADGRPYVIRFRSQSAPGERVSYLDVLRGRLEFDANANDVVILKSAQAGRRLPTYHFAHAVDDHLMRVNLVIRGDEWLSSVPVHLQLFEALGFAPVEYAHIAPLLKVSQGGKRKLSKRKDPEASVEFYEQAGYPPAAVRYYLRGLANGRLAELPLARALAEPIDLARIGGSGALVDLVKLAGLSADYIAGLPSEEVLAAVREWARRFDPELAEVLRTEADLALRALRIERDGTPNPRKDLRTWSDFRPVYGSFFDRLFRPPAELGGKLAGLDPSGFAAAFVAEYRPTPDRDQWLSWLRGLAGRHGFAADAAEYRRAPEAYQGTFREAAQVIRVALTGSARSPDLHAVALALGPDAVRARVGALRLVKARLALSSVCLPNQPRRARALFRHHESKHGHDRPMTVIEREKLLSEGAVIQAMVMHSEPSAADRRISQVRLSVRFPDGQAVEFGEELANLYQPAPGSPEARRLAEVREAGQLRHPDRVPKIQLPLSAGERVSVRYDAADRSRIVIDVPALQKRALRDYLKRSEVPARARTGPPWVVPAQCPNCGAPVDQATAARDADPRCQFCHQPVPVRPA